MTTILQAAQWLEYVSAAITLVFGIFFAINKMSHDTSHDMRCAWVCMSAGAMATFLMPSVSHPLSLVGVALFVIADKRGREAPKESLIEFL